MARVAAPFLRLAGVRVEPREPQPARHARRLRHHAVRDRLRPRARRRRLADPRRAPGRRLRRAARRGRADGKRFAFQNIAADAVELWLGDATTGEVHRVAGVRLNPMLGGTVQWMADQKTLLVKLVPDGLGAPPPAPVVPSGPSIQETDGAEGRRAARTRRATRSRTSTTRTSSTTTRASQLALVDATTGAVTPIGKVGAYDDVDARARRRAHPRRRRSTSRTRT